MMLADAIAVNPAACQGSTVTVFFPLAPLGPVPLWARTLYGGHLLTPVTRLFPCEPCRTPEGRIFVALQGLPGAYGRVIDDGRVTGRVA